MIAHEILFNKKSHIIKRTPLGYVVKHYDDFIDRIYDYEFPRFPHEERNIPLPKNSPFMRIDKNIYSDGSTLYKGITPDGKSYWSCHKI